MKLSILFIILGLGAMLLAGGQHDRLDVMTYGEDRKYEEVAEGISPTVRLVTVMLGPFRGVLADIMWVRSSRLQQEGKVFELVQLADWITKLEPRFAAVWDYHGWNLSYNVSVMFTRPEQRWRWVRAGLVLLRDGGLHYNPSDPSIHRSLAWTYQHKLGFNSDTHHRYYKAKWFDEMEAIIPGGFIDYDALPEEVFGDSRPDYEALLASGALNTNQYRMIVDYKLEPKRTKRVDVDYGPLDWRNVLTHAIFWADRGLEFSKDDDAERLHTVLFQSMKAYFEEGVRIEVPESELIYFRPDFDIVPKVDAVYERAQKEFPERQTFKTGHRYFLQAAARKFYAYGREDDARRLFAKMVRVYPDDVQQKDFESFVSEVVPNKEEFEQLTPSQIFEVVMNQLVEAAQVRAVGGDPIVANVTEAEALGYHTEYQAGLDKEQGVRVELPPFERMKAEAEKNARQSVMIDRIVAPLLKAERIAQKEESTASNQAEIKTLLKQSRDAYNTSKAPLDLRPFEMFQHNAAKIVEDEIRAAKEALEQKPGNL